MPSKTAPTMEYDKREAQAGLEVEANPGDFARVERLRMNGGRSSAEKRNTSIFCNLSPFNAPTPTSSTWLPLIGFEQIAILIWLGPEQPPLSSGLARPINFADMNSVSNEIEEASLLDNNGEISQSQIDPNLFKAAAAGNLEPFKDMAREVIERLLTAKTKNTILHINIISQERENVSTKFVAEILEKCPSLLLQVNAKGDTPLHVAAKFGHSDIVRVLVERAKLPQHENEELESRVGAARQMIRMTNNEKNTALHEAVCHQNVDVVELLTKEDPDYQYSANNYGKTPLYMAADYRSSNMVLALFVNSTSVSHEGPNRKTALHAAAMEFPFVGTALRKLLEKKKNLIKETDQYGWTPIHYVAYHGNYRTINLLLETDQSASNIADKDGKMTALHLAAGQGHAKIVEAIISKNPECYELVDNKEWNFLHYAMVSFHVGQLRNLLENNPLARSLIDEGDAEGNTPLHVLAAVRPTEFHDVMNRSTQANYDAVNKQNVSVRHIFNYGYPELKEEIQKLSKEVGRGQYSKGVIFIREVQKYVNKENYKDTRASHLVVAALIATVAFAAAFTIPGGYRSENGTAILRRNKAFQLFMVADSIAMAFSLSAVVTHFWLSYVTEETKDFNEDLFHASIWFTLWSMAAMVIAFVTGTYAMLAPSLGLAIITSLIGLSFFLPAILIVRLS
ncbi:ANK REP REGION domain-containing protein [Citrus sinensis]|uniref:ANK REP REGION domain-containing protein n=1 Tax=Citrus sinensis TaxID=2711 RepID=A0ACB8I2F7_CITSI|nr:ANK REP REGION domain-containing protein [Citrus sinensis]